MNWKQELRQLKLDYLKRTAPDFYRLSGGERMKLKPYTDQATNGLTNAVYDWLKYNNHWVNRINTTGVARKINGKLIYTTGSTNRGTADLSALIAGKLVQIEIKCAATKDRMSKYQVAEKERIERSGGIYIVVSSMDQFAAWYQRFCTSSTAEPEAAAQISEK